MRMYIHEIVRMLALPQGAAETGPTPLRSRIRMRDQRMRRQKRREMLRHADRPHARTAAAMRNAERLVQIEVADVRADVAGPAKADLRVHVRAVHVDLSAVLVHDRRRSR